MIGDKVVYSVEMSFDDCAKLLKVPVNIEPMKKKLDEEITKDGFNPDDFTFSWLTKEQYENKVESNTIEKKIAL